MASEPTVSSEKPTWVKVWWTLSPPWSSQSLPFSPSFRLTAARHTNPSFPHGGENIAVDLGQCFKSVGEKASSGFGPPPDLQSCKNTRTKRKTNPWLSSGTRYDGTCTQQPECMLCMMAAEPCFSSPVHYLHVLAVGRNKRIFLSG